MQALQSARLELNNIEDPQTRRAVQALYNVTVELANRNGIQAARIVVA